MMKRLLLTALFLGLAVPAAHASRFRDWLHGIERHEGLYLRASVGLGYGFLGGEAGNVDMDGMALALSAQLGTMVVEEIGLHADLWGSILTSPASDNFFDGQVRGAASCAVGGVGPGVLFYAGPTNIWVAMGAGVAFSAIESPVVSDVFGDHASRSDGLGFGVHGSSGVGFWAADELALGLGLELAFAWVPLELDTSGVYMSFALSADLTFD